MQEMQFLNSDLQATDVAGVKPRSVPGSVERAFSQGEQASNQLALTTAEAETEGEASFKEVFLRKASGDERSSTGDANVSQTDSKGAVTVNRQVTSFFEQASQSKLQTLFDAQQQTLQDGDAALDAVIQEMPASSDDWRPDADDEETTFGLEGNVAESELDGSERMNMSIESSFQSPGKAQDALAVTQSLVETESTQVRAAQGDEKANVSPINADTTLRLGHEASAETKQNMIISIDSHVSSLSSQSDGDLIGPDGMENVNSAPTLRKSAETGDVKANLDPASALNWRQAFATERTERADQFASALVKDGVVSRAKGASSDMPFALASGLHGSTDETETVEIPVEAFEQVLEDTGPERQASAETSSRKTAASVLAISGATELPGPLPANGLSDDAEEQNIEGPDQEPSTDVRAGNVAPLERGSEAGIQPSDMKPDATVDSRKVDSSLSQSGEPREHEQDVTEQTVPDGDAAPTDLRDPRVQDAMKTPEVGASVGGATTVSSEFLTGEKPDVVQEIEELSGLSTSSREHQISRDLSSPISAANRIELPNRVAMQIADAARQLPDRPVEITLSPEELGKVRLSFQMSENGAMHVVIATERPETLDLLRRNIDSLAAEFQDLGYSDSGFSFESFDQGGQQEDSPGFAEFGGLAPTDFAEDTIAETPDPVRLTLGASSGMDLRL